MKFSQLSIYFEKLDKTASRLTITELLAQLFKNLSVEEIDKTLYLLQGRVGPLYEKRDFGMAEKMVAKSIVLALNIDDKLFKTRYKKIGDLGGTVEKFKKQIVSFENKDLEILEVYNELLRLTQMKGSGSQETKISLFSHLIRQLDPLSCRYLVRIPINNLRLGFSDMTILDAFSWLIKGDKSLRPIIEKAYHVRPDLGCIGKLVKAKNFSKLKSIKPVLFTPILMMRAERLSSSKEIIEKLNQCIIEPKFDGFRLQVHYKKLKDPILDKDSVGKEDSNAKTKGEVRLYSRNLEDVSFMYPDIVKGVLKEIKINEIIFEGEAIGFDPFSGNFLSFQETVQRKRKYGIKEKTKEIPLKFFAFELLYVNGKNYLDKPFIKRRRKLEQSITLTGDIFKDTILLAPEVITKKEKKIDLMFDDAVTKGFEGIIAKKIDGHYKPGAREWNWIKFKRSYSSKINDTIDCIIMGYDYGKGRRTSFGIGAFLVGIYNKKKDKFITIAKVGTGLTDIEWKEIREKCDKFKTKSKPFLYDVDKHMEVDVWIKPVLVVEIKSDEVTRSPIHTAGYALRFPRLEKIRDDKRPDDTTTLEELEKMFEHQGVK